MAAPSMFAVLDRGENHLFGTWNNVFVTIWRGRATLDEMKRVGSVSNLKAIAQVIQGTGLVAASTRMVASGLMLVRKTKTPCKLFDDVASAARWLSPHIRSDAPGHPATPADLLSALEQAWPQA